MTVASQYTRTEVLSRLSATLSAGHPLVIGGAGIGLVAKAAERGGIDLLMVYNTGPFRMAGHGSLAGYLAYGDSNAMTITLGHEVLNAVDETPVIGGIGAADPFRDIGRLIDEMMAMGFSGITNVRRPASTRARSAGTSTPPTSATRRKSTSSAPVASGTSSPWPTRSRPTRRGRWPRPAPTSSGRTWA